MHPDLVDAAVALHRHIYKIRAALGCDLREVLESIERGEALPGIPSSVIHECREDLALLQSAWPKLDAVDCLTVASTVVQAASRSFSFVVSTDRNETSTSKIGPQGQADRAHRYSMLFDRITMRDVPRTFVVRNALSWIAAFDGNDAFDPMSIDIQGDNLTSRSALRLRDKLLANSEGIAMWLRKQAVTPEAVGPTPPTDVPAVSPEPVPVPVPPEPTLPPEVPPYQKFRRQVPSAERPVEILVRGELKVVGTAGDLRRLREKAGLSQGRLAAELGIGQPHISNVESGRDYVSPELATRWWRALAGYRATLDVCGVKAHAIVRGNTVTILRGSSASASESHLTAEVKQLRANLREEGILAPITRIRMRFLQEIKCESHLGPSLAAQMAAALVTGDGRASSTLWVEDEG